MGVELKVGSQDHVKVEDFVAARPLGVSAVTFDVRHLRFQGDAAEAARDAGIAVLIEPLTERLADPGFTPKALSYFDGTVLEPRALSTDASARARLVEHVIEAHPKVASMITPPHFYVDDDRTASVNVALAELAVRSTTMPVRPTLVISRTYAVKTATNLAAEYADIGITQLELRLSPLGGDNERVAKIRSVFGVADQFAARGIEVVLGCSGNIGQTAVALGHATSYSVGVGLREQTNHASAISRQTQPPRPDRPAHRGAGAGIYLPGLAATVPRTLGGALLDDTAIRTRIGCRIGSCAQSISGPARDPRQHYLHARAAEMSDLLHRPAPWRPAHERDRLQRAIDLRQLINAHHLPADANPLKTRTLQSLIDDIAVELAETA